MSLKPTSVPTKRLSSSITSTEMVFKLEDIIGWNQLPLTAADFGTQGYVVFRNSNRTQIEIMEFNPATIASASITIVRRGLRFDGNPTVEDLLNKFEWTAGDTLVDLGTDTPQLWQWLQQYVDDATYAGITQPTFDAFFAATTIAAPVPSFNKMGVGTAPATAVTQTITHGLGKIPTTVRISGYGSSNTSGPGSFSVGGYKAIDGNFCTFITAGNSTKNAATSTDFALRLSINSSGSDVSVGTAVIQNLTATTFDLVWTGTPGTNSAYMWEVQ